MVSKKRSFSSSTGSSEVVDANSANSATEGQGGNTRYPPGEVRKSMKKSIIVPIVPIVPRSEGYSESEKLDEKGQVYPAIKWCFTWFGYPENWQDFFNERRDVIEKFCAGEEICPTTGRPHIQGWLKLFKKNRPVSFLQLPKAIHYEKMYRNATEANNTAYCSKECTNVLHWGVPIDQLKPINITFHPWQTELHALLLQEPDDRTIFWIWEAEGKTGKSKFSKWCFRNLSSVMLAEGKGSDIKNGVINYKKINGFAPKIVIYDVPRTNKDYISYDSIEKVKNMFFFSGKYEGGHMDGNEPHLVVFANDRPDKSSLSEDRWKIAKIVDLALVWETF